MRSQPSLFNARASRPNGSGSPALSGGQVRALRYLAAAPYPKYDHGWRETGRECPLPTARKLEALGLVELKFEDGERRVFTQGFIRPAGLRGGSETRRVTFTDIRARLTDTGKAALQAHTTAIPTRANGILRVPDGWVDAVLAAYLAGKGGTIPLPLAGLGYPKLKAALASVYPSGVVPLFFKIGAGAAQGVTGTKTGGGYPVGIAPGLSARSAASTIHHELRHVVQYLGDETLPQHPKGAFGRPSKGGTASLRITKKLVKAGKGPKGVDPYFTSASEWQPWVGSTADTIVKSLIDHPAKSAAETNQRILSGTTSGIFYQKTDPTTRRELLRQVYVEVMRQLEGTSYVSAKAVGTAAPKASGGFTVGGKVLVAPAAAQEMFSFYGITSNEVGTVLSVGPLLSVKFGSKVFKTMLPKLVVPFTPAYLPAPKPKSAAAAKKPASPWLLSIRVKGVKPGDAATSDPTFKGFASQGYARFDLLSGGEAAVKDLAKTVAAKVDDPCYGGKIVRVRIVDAKKKEHTVYKRPGT